MDLFKYAVRNKLRFTSTKGELTTEQLFDLPLTDRKGSGADLDTIAKTIAADLKEAAQPSFVSDNTGSEHTALSNKLEIVKAVIATIKDEQAAKTSATIRSQELRRIDDAIAKREETQYDDMSLEQLQALRASKG